MPIPSASAAHSAWYALRRTLPPHACDKNLRELVEFLPRYGVDEVIVIVDPEELSHGITPLDWLEMYQPHLIRIRESLASIDVAYSLNPWVTHGHVDRARDARNSLPGVTHFVGHDGAVSHGCVCSLDPIWQAYMEQALTLYSETGPRVLWVEDDIRLFNHGAARFGCFCDLHLAQFSKAVGIEVRRKKLVAALLQPDNPHPCRTPWLDLQGWNMVEVANFIATIVQRVSPDTSLGLMSSGPRGHCCEGRKWNAFCNSLAGNQRLYSRPPLGNYDEQSLRGLYFSQDSVKLTLRRDLTNEPVTLLGLFNLSLDSWPRVHWTLSDDRTLRAMSVLTSDGIWQSDQRVRGERKADHWEVAAEIDVIYDRPLFVCIQWEP